MHDNETNSFADQLLNAALAGYADDLPPAGLEQRILAHLAEQPQPSARWPWLWLPAGALALVALLAGALLFSRRESASPPAVITSQPPKVTPGERPAPESSAPAVTIQQRAPQRAQRATPVTVKPARAAQFPAPSSPTEQERLLMRYLGSSPREVLVASVRSPGPLLDLQVRDLEVPMLQLEPLPEQSGKPMVH